MKYLWILLLMIPFLMGPKSCEEHKGDPLEEVYRSLGGKDLIKSVVSLEYTSSGHINPINEDFVPLEGKGQRVSSQFELQYYRDVSGHNLRLDYVISQALFGLKDLKTGYVIQGQLGSSTGHLPFNVPIGALKSDRVGAILAQNLILSPHEILMGSLEGKYKFKGSFERNRNGESYRVYKLYVQHRTVMIYINTLTQLIDLVKTIENDVLLRDSWVEVHFDDWKKTKFGLLFPYQAEIKSYGRATRKEQRSNVRVNFPTGKGWFDFPQGVRPRLDEKLFRLGFLTSQSYLSLGMARYLDGRPTVITGEELFPGITLVKGTHHNSLVVAQEYGIIIVDAPGSKEQGKALVEWVKKAYPNKPITFVIQTHHHFDHSAGLRTVMALSPVAKVVAHELSTPFYRDRLFARSTTSQLVKDDYEMNRRKVFFVSLPRKSHLTARSRVNPLEIWPVRTKHSKDMVVVVVPGARLLFNSDLESPGSGLRTKMAEGYAFELNRFLSREAIANVVEFIAGGHGNGTETVGEFRKKWGF